MLEKCIKIGGEFEMQSYGSLLGIGVCMYMWVSVWKSDNIRSLRLYSTFRLSGS